MRHRFILCLLLALAAPLAGADGILDAEREPISYGTAPVSDPVAHLAGEIAAGRVSLQWEPGHGYLRSLLQELKIPVSSQMLVFSQTSFQRDRIAPWSPRALYFNDDVYVGWVQDGTVIEIASIDPRQGTIFYTLAQKKLVSSKITRQRDECLQCHDGGMSQNIPGLVVRSVYPSPGGTPLLSAGTFITDQTSPLKERWGGWYVTGRHGDQRHMGNLTVSAADDPDHLDLSSGANLTDLSRRVDVKPYLSPHSDIVALMVLDHQAHAHNLITRANWFTRLALRDEQALNQALGQPAGTRSESTPIRIRSACEPLVKYLLFCDEAKLTDPIEGTSGFAKEFSARGPRDSRGRSLRDLDLKTRLMKYPLSYLIYSEQFDALPELAKTYVYRRLEEVLTGKDTSAAFSHLDAGTRKAIIEIVRETKRGLPKDWGLK